MHFIFIVTKLNDYRGVGPQPICIDAWACIPEYNINYHLK